MNAATKISSRVSDSIVNECERARPDQGSRRSWFYYRVRVHRTCLDLSLSGPTWQRNSAGCRTTRRTSLTLRWPLCCTASSPPAVAGRRRFKRDTLSLPGFARGPRYGRYKSRLRRHTHDTLVSKNGGSRPSKCPSCFRFMRLVLVESTFLVPDRSGSHVHAP